MYKTTLKIDGMMCGMCESHIADVIRRTISDAKKVSVSHTKGVATFLTEKEPSKDELMHAIVIPVCLLKARPMSGKDCSGDEGVVLAAWICTLFH